ncbi:MAG: Asp-tRNA(Asn)/Glu-tRNA(Gln) amidotransferase subunit GatB [Gemmatimonadetes bacterium]|nr:Asp-tRNA(Asn)/Glu-tRNA(Gln) amidotransferase subunit GatB [Gemmatimonadota bacterium]MYD24979.1 Asp-tRNA(Asn)/Glu-tRNA(Gln) amidotransferase subunit GatB [Gemmatimonadota bacterium]MYI98334.1 Asp-tRNA(Asn)/Glu-tRNA(Gln) amidotransferase subunit GatB [Gemmatimonadota bacterium]
MNYESVIGLEVHAQLLTNSKIFCGCPVAFGGEPNTRVCPICLGMPGVLPVLNRRAVEYTIRMALAVDGHVAETSAFARKNYFYPDLPKGYQISQYDRAGEPISLAGGIEIEGEDGPRFVRLRRIHLEEEAGKSIHNEPGYDPDLSYIDFNRTGVPLMEIVSEPDIRSPREASAYLARLRQILQYIGVCDGNMDEGSLRCDANVSIRKPGDPLGELVEIKNMNSMRSMERALEFEIARQSELLDDGGTVVRQTRLWNEEKRETFPMRSKEEAHDYRYFPDPDLVTVEIAHSWVDEIGEDLPELPDVRMQRFVDEYGLPQDMSRQLTENRARADFFEACVSHATDEARTVSNWMLSELLRVQHENHMDQGTLEARIPPDHLAQLLGQIKEGKISGKIGKDVLDIMAETGKAPAKVIEEQGLVQISDTGELEGVVDGILAEHPDDVAEYRAGKTKLLGFFMGQVMRATQGKANPKMVNELLQKKLAEG